MYSHAGILYYVRFCTSPYHYKILPNPYYRMGYGLFYDDEGNLCNIGFFVVLFFSLHGKVVFIVRIIVPDQAVMSRTIRLEFCRILRL